jgi:hypothetical protein
MLRPYDPYIPQTIGEIIDKLASMTLSAPTFIDSLGIFPRNINTEFFALKEGFKVVRKRLGEERYAQLVDMADEMRAHFEADPEDDNGESQAGRQLIFDMEDLLRQKPAAK